MGMGNSLSVVYIRDFTVTSTVLRKIFYLYLKFSYIHIKNISAQRTCKTKHTSTAINNRACM